MAQGSLNLRANLKLTDGIIIDVSRVRFDDGSFEVLVRLVDPGLKSGDLILFYVTRASRAWPSFSLFSRVRWDDHCMWETGRKRQSICQVHFTTKVVGGPRRPAIHGGKP